jgi:hypothetical protein
MPERRIAALATRIVLVGGMLLGTTPELARAQTGVERQVYFGEQHVHTSWPFDAFAFGDTVTGPDDFYRYAKGQPTPHPGGFDVKITKPLDWAARAFPFFEPATGSRIGPERACHFTTIRRHSNARKIRCR